MAAEASVRRTLGQLHVDLTTSLDVPGGTSLSGSLSQAVLSADFVCVVLGAETPSPTVMYEAGIAVGARRPLVVVTSIEADQAVAQTIDAPIIRYRTADDSAIHEGLSAYVSNIQPLAAELKVNWDVLSTETVSSPIRPHLEGSRLERTIAAWLEQSGAAVVAIHPVQRGFEADMVATFPALGDAFSQVVVEVKSGDRTSWTGFDLDKLRNTLNMFGSRIGILVSPDISLNRSTIEGGKAVLAVSMDELDQWVQSGQLARRLTRLRNELVHTRP
ncbi:hypothetical protein ACWEKR_32180 [Nocardia sp. NPDC004573]